MGRLFILDYNHIPSHDCIVCGMCRTRVAFIKDLICKSQEMSTGASKKMFNIEVPEDERYHQQEDGATLADTYCVRCGNLLGWKIIAISQPNKYFKEGRFVMKLDQLINWTDVALLNCLFGGANEQNADQDGDVNEQNDDEDGGANEQAPNDQDGGVNEQNADQDGDVNEHDDDEDGDTPMN